jgi:phage-related protein
MDWRIVYFNDLVRREVEALSVEHRAKFRRIAELIAAKGLERVHEPYIKHIGDKLWEMRLSDRGGIARIIYVTASNRRIVLLHAFEKKTRKTPQRALETAREQLKEVR